MGCSFISIFRTISTILTVLAAIGSTRIRSKNCFSFSYASSFVFIFIVYCLWGVSYCFVIVFIGFSIIFLQYYISYFARILTKRGCCVGYCIFNLRIFHLDLTAAIFQTFFSICSLLLIIFGLGLELAMGWLVGLGCRLILGTLGFFIIGVFCCCTDVGIVVILKGLSCGVFFVLFLVVFTCLLYII